jgi:hypothetical protein
MKRMKKLNEKRRQWSDPPPFSFDLSDQPVKSEIRHPHCNPDQDNNALYKHTV